MARECTDWILGDTCGDIRDTRYELKEPNQTIVRITSRSNPGINGQWGTGTVIGPNKVLTAAHVITRLTPDDGIIYLGEGGTNSTSYSILSITRHPQYTVVGDKKYEHDLAVITTRENFWAYTPFMEAPDPLYLTDVTWTGFPGDVIPERGRFSQWETKHTIGSEDRRFFTLHTCSKSYAGQSGSGLRINNEGGPREVNGQVIGVLVGGCGPNDSIFSLLRGENYQFVIREVFGSTISESKKHYDLYHDCNCHKQHDYEHHKHHYHNQNR